MPGAEAIEVPKSRLEEIVTQQFHERSGAGAFDEVGLTVEKVRRTWVIPLLDAVDRNVRGPITVARGHEPIIVIWPDTFHKQMEGVRVNHVPGRIAFPSAELMHDVVRGTPYVCLNVSANDTLRYSVETALTLTRIAGHACTALEGAELMRRQAWHLFGHSVIFPGSHTKDGRWPIMRARGNEAVMELIAKDEALRLDPKVERFSLATCTRRIFP